MYRRDLDGCKYLGYVNVFDIYVGKLDDGAEIFSSIQMSDPKPKEYLDLHKNIKRPLNSSVGLLLVL